MTAAGPIELVVTDLDGTLWGGDEVVPRATRKAWDEIERRGIPVVVATGRRVGSTRAPLAATGLSPSAICLNGALGLDLASGERFHLASIRCDAAAQILASFREAELQPCVYVDRDDIAVYVDASPSTHPDHLAGFGHDVATDDLARVCLEETVLAFSLLGGDEAILSRVAETIGDAGTTHLSADRGYGGHTLTVAGPTMSKWLGVEAFCLRAGIDPTRILAIGDGPNDTELLSAAAVAVVPADGHAAALSIADHVVAPAVDGGWAELLDIL